MPRYRPNNLLGVGLMLLAMLLFEVMDAAVKWLVSAEMSAIQVIAVRSLCICLLIPLPLLARGRIRELHTRQPLRHLLRGMLGFLAPFSFFTALKNLPLADATVVFFSGAFILTAASALVLGEKVGVHRWSAVAIGFAGVVIAIDTEGGGDLASYLLVLCAASVYAYIFISGKQLSADDSITTLVFSLHLGMGLSAAVLLPWVWQPLGVVEFSNLLLIAALALLAHYVFAAAFALADVSLLAPFEYTALIWATIIGYLVWSDFPSPRVWAGAAIIVGCGLYVIRRETLLQKARTGLGK